MTNIDASKLSELQLPATLGDTKALEAGVKLLSKIVARQGQQINRGNALILALVGTLENKGILVEGDQAFFEQVRDEALADLSQDTVQGLADLYAKVCDETLASFDAKEAR